MKKIDLSGFKPPSASMLPVRAKELEPFGSVEPAAPVDMLAHLVERFPDRISFSPEDVAAMLGVDYETVR
ncbi:MAG: hypothetical protein IPP94_16685 [Ignavibacteria bacterium]|nr:hypothetical protein [Ignavibacteria bacterium]